MHNRILCWRNKMTTTNETNRKITYEDLKLGEKAKEAFFKGETSENLEKNYPVYLNTREFYSGLNVTDLAIAAVLGGLNSFYVGDTGTGKSQLAQDIYNYYFGGNLLDRGHGIKMKGRPDLDIANEVYTRLNKEKLSREPTEAIQAMYHFADEINRCPPVTQNQFFGIGEGTFEHPNGMKLSLGKNGYSMAVATANLGNGEFQGTFESDKALYNRFPISIDFDYDMFKPTKEDRVLIDLIRAANPKLKEAPIRDISQKILEAEKEIKQRTRNPNLETSAVLNYLKFGLENCLLKGTKEKIWPINCQDCSHNSNGKALCSFIRNPQTRTSQALDRYIASLEYLYELKFPGRNLDKINLAFKAFEIVGTYQALLNPSLLRTNYQEQNPKMMAETTQKLKEDFTKNQDIILTSLFEADKGNENFNDYFSKDGKYYLGYSKLSEESKGQIKQKNPFTDSGQIGLEWVDTMGKILVEINKINGKNNNKQNDKQNDKRTKRTI